MPRQAQASGGGDGADADGAAPAVGVLSCRIVITGTLPGICYAAGMTSFLYAKGIRVLDYAQFAELLRDQIRERAEQW